MTDAEHKDDAALEMLFEAARRDAPPVPDALMAQVIADAAAVQPQLPRARGWRSWFAALGRMPALGGLITATCVGFWLGVAPPQGLPDLGGAVLGLEVSADDAMDALELSGFGWDIEEG